MLPCRRKKTRDPISCRRASPVASAAGRRCYYSVYSQSERQGEGRNIDTSFTPSNATSAAAGRRTRWARAALQVNDHGADPPHNAGQHTHLFVCTTRGTGYCRRFGKVTTAPCQGRTAQNRESSWKGGAAGER